MDVQHGYYIEDLQPGLQAVFSKTVTEADIVNFAGVTGDFNPLHVNKEFAAATRFGARVAHGVMGAGMLSAVMGTRLPGPGAVYLSQHLQFLAPIYIGDTVTARVIVKELQMERRRVVLTTQCLVRDHLVLDGEATLLVDSHYHEPALIEAAALPTVLKQFWEDGPEDT